MTVSNVTARVKYNGNGTTTSFAYSFLILVDADMRVTVTSATGVPTTLLLNDDYTVTGAGNANGGTVVLSAGSLCPTGSTLTLLRDMGLTQEDDYVDGQGFSAESVELALDKLTMKMQSVAVVAEDAGEAAGTISGAIAGAAAGTISGAIAGAAAVHSILPTGGDDTAMIQAADDAAVAGGYGLVFVSGTYLASGLQMRSSGIMLPGALLKYNGAENGTLFEIPAGADPVKWSGDLYFDGNEQNCTCFRALNNSNTIGNIHVQNVTGTSAGDTSFIGVGINGDSNTIGDIYCKNFVNAGHTNESFPQSVGVFGDKNNIGTVYLDTVQAGLVLGSLSGITTVKGVVGHGAEDNGVYQLGGTLILGELVYHGSADDPDEPAVFQGSGHIGKITIVGPCGGLGFDNIGDITVDEIAIVPDAAGLTAKYLFRTRALNVAAGRLSIGKITGTIRGTTLFSVAVGTFDYLHIGEMNVRFLYDPTVATSLSGWANLSALAGFRINNARIEIIDETDAGTSATIFTMPAPTVTKNSYVHNLDVTIYSSDGVTLHPSATFRGTGFAQALIDTSGVTWRTDIGPYLIATNAGLAKDSASQAPVAGEWAQGKVLRGIVPANGGTEGWVCVFSGTPGTWVEFGGIQRHLAETTTLATLRDFVRGTTTTVYAEAHTAAGDGGGGPFRYVSGAAPGTYVDNNGTIIVPTGGDGSAAWLRVYSGPLNVRWCGFMGYGTADDTAKLQAFIDAFPGKTFTFPSYASIYGAINITGAGTSLEGLGLTGTGINQVLANSDTFVFKPTTAGTSAAFLDNPSIQNLSISHAGVAATSHVSGAGVRFIQCNGYSLENVTVNDAYGGILVEGGQFGVLRNFKLFASAGIYEGAETALLHFKQAPIGGGSYQACYTVAISDFKMSATLLRGSCIRIANGDGLQFSQGYIGNGKNSLVRVKADRDSGHVAVVTFVNTYMDCVGAGKTLNGVEIAADGFSNTTVYSLTIGSGCTIGNGDGIGIICRKPETANLKIDGTSIINMVDWAIDFEGLLTMSDLSITGNRLSNNGSATGGTIRAVTGKSLLLSSNIFSAVENVAVLLSGNWDEGAITSNINTSNVSDLSNSATFTRPLVIAGNSSRSSSAALTWRGVGLNNIEVTDSTVLDWYKEDVFIPSITFGGESVGVAYTTQSGEFTRIGNRVFFSLYITLSAKGSSTGASVITGLPYQAGADHSYVASIRLSNMLQDTGGTVVSPMITASNTAISLIKMDIAGVTDYTVPLTDADFTDTSVITITGSYKVL